MGLFTLPFETFSGLFELWIKRKTTYKRLEKFRKYVVLWSGERVSNPPPAAWEAAAHIKDLS